MDIQAAKEFLETQSIDNLQNIIVLQIASLTFSRNGDTMSTTKGKR